MEFNLQLQKIARIFYELQIEYIFKLENFFSLMGYCFDIYKTLGSNISNRVFALSGIRFQLIHIRY